MRQDYFHSFETTSVGGVPVAQTWVDFCCWENILNSNPQLVGIVELGTWKGGFSFWLDMQARARGLSFSTFDIFEPDVEVPGFEKIDIYRYADELGKRFGEIGAVALFCDGGNKPRELKTFPPYLAPGSIVAVHDWGTETLATDVPDFLEELYGVFSDDMRSVTRWFRMKEGESE